MHLYDYDTNATYADYTRDLVINIRAADAKWLSFYNKANLEFEHEKLLCNTVMSCPEIVWC